MILRRWWNVLALWLRNLLSIRLPSSILGSFGFQFLAIEIVTFFFDDPKIADQIRNYWWVFLLIGLAVGAWRCKPNRIVSQRINGRDVTIEVAVGDLFAFSGALIVGTNTTFDTRISRELISDRSVQGLFTRRYYSDDEQLDKAITSKLNGKECQTLQQPRIGKLKKYARGTCVRLDLKDRVAYLLAIADLNDHGVASATFDDIKDSLASLWQFIGTRGLKEAIVMPVLGTGHSRILETRDEVVREIVKSFIAACSERTFADKLTIVITPQDMTKHRISLEELGDFLRHACKYTDFSASSRPMIGTPV